MAITIQLTAENLAGAALKELQSNVQSALAGIQAKQDELERRTTQATSRMLSSYEKFQSSMRPLQEATLRQSVVQGNLDRAFLQTGQAAQRQENAFERLRRSHLETERATAQAQRTTVSFGQALGTVRGLAAAFGVALGAQALVSFVRGVVDAGVQMERFQRTLQAATGSASEGARAYAFVVAESNRLGQSVEELLPRFAQLAAATRNTTLEGEKTRQLFSALAGAGQAVGLSSEATGRALVGLTQIISQNAIQLDEFRNQFASQIPGAMAATAAAMGRTTEQLLEGIRRQQIGVEELIEGVTQGLQEIQAAAPDMSQTVEGAFARFRNAAFQLKADLARSGLLDFLQSIVEEATRGVREVLRLLGLRPATLEGQQQRLVAELRALENQRETIERSRRGEAVDPLFLVPRQFAEERLQQIAQREREIRQELEGLAEAYKAQAAAEAERQRVLRQRQEEERAALEAERRREEALRAAPERLRAEEAALAERLKREEAAVKQSFAERRRLVDEELARRLQAEPQAVEQIERQRTAIVRQLAQEESAELQRIRLAAVDEQLQASLRTFAAERAAAAASGQAKAEDLAKIDRQITQAKERAETQRQEIAAGTRDFELKIHQQGLDDQLKAEKAHQDLLEKVREQGLKDFAQQTERLRTQIEREEEQELQRMEREYAQFSDRVTGHISDIFFNFLSGTLDILQTFKQTFLRIFADILAEVIRPIVVPVVAQLIGGFAGAFAPSVGAAVLQATGLGAGAAGVAGGGAAGAAGGVGVLDVLGVGALATRFSSALSGLITFLDDLPVHVGALFGLQVFGPGQVGPIPAGAVRLGMGGLGILGGLAGLGGGIFAALQAQTLSGQIGGALGAAGGATALAAALAPALNIAFAPIFGPIGLALAALAPLLGGLLGLGAPKGPRLALGALGGVGVGVTEGRLALTGELTGGTLQRSQVSRSAAEEIQRAQLNTVQQAIAGMIQAINEIALDPDALLGPTQRALDEALRGAIPIQSSNRQKMQQDIEEQMRFLGPQLTSFFLDPLADAFGQLRGADLETQMAKLPQTLGALGQLFQQMNTQLDELAKVQNTDVLRRLGEVRARLDAFFSRLVETTQDIANTLVGSIQRTLNEDVPPLLTRSLQVQAVSIPGLFRRPLEALAAIIGAQAQLQTARPGVGAPLQDQITTLVGTILDAAFTSITQAVARPANEFASALGVILALPDAVVQLNPVLQEIVALAQRAAQVVQPLAQNITELEHATRPVSAQLQELASRMTELRTSIADAGDHFDVALPLFDQLRQAIVADMNLRIQQLQRLGALQQTVGGLLRQQGTPAQQVASVQGEIARLEAQLASGTGDSVSIMEELVRLNQELIQLGSQTNNLLLAQEATANLAEIQALLAQQLIEIGGTTDVQEAIRSIQEQALAELKAINEQLRQLFIQAGGFQVGGVVRAQQVVQAQQGRLVGMTPTGPMFAQSGRSVSVMAEPGELAFPGPLPRQAIQALDIVNRTFPRFQVGGVGRGDITPLVLPERSYILNREASRVVQAHGAQQGHVMDALVSRPASMPEVVYRQIGGLIAQPMPLPQTPRPTLPRFQAGGEVKLTFSPPPRRFQTGGSVPQNGDGQGKSPPIVIQNHVHLNNVTIRSDQGKTIKELADDLVREMERRTFSQFGARRKGFP